jgi:hypothetical protein
MADEQLVTRIVDAILKLGKTAGSITDIVDSITESDRDDADAYVRKLLSSDYAKEIQKFTPKPISEEIERFKGLLESGPVFSELLPIDQAPLRAQIFDIPIRPGYRMLCTWFKSEELVFHCSISCPSLSLANLSEAQDESLKKSMYTLFINLVDLFGLPQEWKLQSAVYSINRVWHLTWMPAGGAVQ